jgi:peptidoglycan/LPS O-acetylase OafA/YrhL
MNITRKEGWDLFRIFMVIVVFAFHANMHLGSSFGVFNKFVTAGSLCMSGFFMLSGAVLYYRYGDRRVFDNRLKMFYLKRFLSILPLYWVVTILYFLDNPVGADGFKMLPIEILGIQALFPVDFYMVHNGGTWFVSCLLVCYAVFPLIVKLIDGAGRKRLIIIGVLLTSLDIYALLITYRLGLVELYSTPVSRGIQFAIGCIIAPTIKAGKDGSIRLPVYAVAAGTVAIAACLIIITTKMVDLGLFADADILQKLAMYDVVAVPNFIILIFLLGCIDTNVGGKILMHASNLAYAFFLAQLFIFERARWIFETFDIHNNKLIILTAFGICVAFAAILHYIVERPAKTFVQKMILSRQ